jgi:hypothetical protein
MTKKSKTQKRRDEARQPIIESIYERAGRACKAKGQSHLMNYEKKQE